MFKTVINSFRFGRGGYRGGPSNAPSWKKRPASSRSAPDASEEIVVRDLEDVPSLGAAEKKAPAAAPAPEQPSKKQKHGESIADVRAC